MSDLSTSTFGYDARRSLICMKFASSDPKEDIHAAAVQIAKRVCEISAGVTMAPILGVWASDGSLDLDRYEGPFQVEPGVGFEITVPEDRVEELYTELKQIVAEACRCFALTTVEWVHTDIVSGVSGVRRAAHFQIDPSRSTESEPVSPKCEGRVA